MIDEKMTVRELRSLKIDLEAKISDDVKLFEKATGLIVKDIHLLRGFERAVDIDVEL